MSKYIYECIRCTFKQEYNFNEKIKKDFKCYCRECGAPMLETPFDKLVAIKEDIVNYIKFFEVDKILPVDYYLYDGKFESFPTILGIKEFIQSSTNLEMFVSRIKSTLHNIAKYINVNYTSTFSVEFTPLYKSVEEKEEIIIKLLKKLGIDYKFEPLKIPIKEVVYNAIINFELIDISNDILHNLGLLIEKLLKIIKLHNFYGDTYKHGIYGSETAKSLDKLSKLEILQKKNDLIKEIINKNYFFDIFSDGKKEINEMMNAFWRSLELIMLYSQKINKFEFINDGNTISIDDIQMLYINSRYIKINNLLEGPVFAFSTYENMCEIYDVIYDKVVLDNKAKSIVNPNKAEQKLNKLIGLSAVKESINKMKAYLLKNKSDNKNLKINCHMVFYGNPGTGKTEVARIIAQILYENKILPTNKFIETDRKGLVGEYVGETPQKVNKLVNSAMGGVLFIDEAYSLVPKDGSFDYGNEAISTLIKAMEDNRGKFCVILAGYKKPMKDMIETNPGFKSRIQFHIDFPNYSRDELGEILNFMTENNKYSMSEDVKSKILDVTDILRKEVNFANAREIRNILDHIIMNQNLRTSSLDDYEIQLEDIDKFIKDSKLGVPKNDKNRILTSDEELDQLIGLEVVKKTVKKIKAFAIRNKDNNLNMHMCFYGNPGTGKTEVARIISRILHDVGVLEESKLIETDSSGLIGKYLGETAQKTLEIIDNAMGGVLFIDEAYALIDGDSGYGKEAITILLKEMEDKRGKFCTILAGYKTQMNNMLNSNPGFKSRIMFNIDFPDYSPSELRSIAEFILNKKNYLITSEALDMICNIVEFKRLNPDFANAREIRNIIGQVILNQNYREEDINNNIIIIDDVMMYIKDENLDINYNSDEIIKTNKPTFKINIEEIKYLYKNRFKYDSTYIEQAIVSISKGNSQGTGFIISPKGYLITCAHCVVDNIMNVRVTFNLGKNKKIKTYYEAELISIDKVNDIALLKILEDEVDFNYLHLSFDFKYKPLSRIIMAGYPFGGETFTEISFTTGKIASTNYIENNRKVVFADMFGKPGNSGSPIIDKTKNKVIGIYFGGISNGSNEIINCFSPVEFIWDLLNK